MPHSDMDGDGGGRGRSKETLLKSGNLYPRESVMQEAPLGVSNPCFKWLLEDGLGHRIFEETPMKPKPISLSNRLVRLTRTT